MSKLSSGKGLVSDGRDEDGYKRYNKATKKGTRKGCFGKPKLFRKTKEE